MGKPIIALALLQLVEDGLVQLDDPVSTWLPELANPAVLVRTDARLDETVRAIRPILVEDVLTSRMGAGILALPPGATPVQREISRLGLVGFGPDDPADPMGPDEWLGRLGALPLLAQPGELWFYNIATIVQGILVARIAGTPLSDQIARRITDPLGMTDTGFTLASSKAERLTACYAGDLSQRDAPQTSAWRHQPAFETSLVSTASDYAAFVRMLHSRGHGPSGPIIAEPLLRAMLSDHLTQTQRNQGAAFLDGRGWGYGVSVDPGHRLESGWTGEIGWAGGLGTSWTSRLGDDSAVIILGCRAIDHPEVYAAHVEITRRAFDEMPTLMG